MKKVLLCSAEIFAAVFVFLLPLKFGTIVALPAITMIYWKDLLPFLISPFPYPYLPVLSAVFLLWVVCAVPEKFTEKKDPVRIYGILWGILSLASLPGIFGAEYVPDGILYFIPYVLSLGAFMLGLTRLLCADPAFEGRIVSMFCIGYILSIVMGLQQYFDGFDQTLAELSAYSDISSPMQENMLARLKESRVSGTFSACNAFAGYVVLGLIPAAVWAWKLGDHFSPQKISRPLFMIPVAAAGAFVLLKTGSRGALLSLCAAVFLFCLTAKIPKKWKILLGGVILPAGIAGFSVMVFFWRGAKSILFRFDYFQGAFRMMLNHLLCGEGWAAFQRKFMLMKWIEDPEAPAGPHNFPLAMGCQSGVLGFLAACILVLFPLWYAARRLSKQNLKELLSGDQLMISAMFTGVLACSIHSMQELLFETPCAMLAWGTLAACMMTRLKDNPDSEGVEKTSILRKSAVNISLILFAGVLLYGGCRLLRFDHAMASLNDSVEIRPGTQPVPLHDIQRLYQECRKMNPASTYPLQTLSTWQLRNGDIYGSAMLLEESVKLDPNSSNLHFGLYRVLSLIPGRGAEAEKHRQRAIELAPFNWKYREPR